jgi:hypothetical protein
MIEYLFFNKAVSDRFIAVLKQKGVAWTEEIEPVQDGISIKVSEDIGDDLWDELDDVYDQMSVDDHMMLEAGMRDEGDVSTAGIYLQLKNGEQTIARVDPDIMSRILEVISMEEFNTFLEVIVSSVEEPDDSAICKTS